MWLVIVALFFLIGFLRMHGASYGLSFWSERRWNVAREGDPLCRTVIMNSRGTHREERKHIPLTLMAGSRDLIFRAELHDGRVVYQWVIFPDPAQQCIRL